MKCLLFPMMSLNQSGKIICIAEIVKACVCIVHIQTEIRVWKHLEAILSADQLTRSHMCTIILTITSILYANKRLSCWYLKKRYLKGFICILFTVRRNLIEIKQKWHATNSLSSFYTENDWFLRLYNTYEKRCVYMAFKV
jgi:hypothetical protein